MPSAFAAQIAPEVIMSCVNTGIFPSVVIAQAIQESGSGTSTLARQFNNLFGHAASSAWKGRVGRTSPHGRLWRAYDSIAQCVTAHINVLRKPVYRLQGILNATTPYAQALALQKGGFDAGADHDQYAAKLSRIIRSLNLQQYDQQLVAIERKRNANGLAYHEQPAVTKVLHNIFA